MASSFDAKARHCARLEDSLRPDRIRSTLGLARLYQMTQEL